ncbi:MAG TPA: hypothetical protein VJ871_06040 [Bacteroidales bacterium]|nr:hypothetical protein [Bacteroidales bacterium]
MSNHSYLNYAGTEPILNQASVQELLSTAGQGIISIRSDKGGIYAISAHFVWDEVKGFYVYCLPEERRLSQMDVHQEVLFSVVGKVPMMSNKKDVEFQSFNMGCTLRRFLSTDEKRDALKQLKSKYDDFELTDWPGNGMSKRKSAQILHLEMLEAFTSCI